MNYQKLINDAKAEFGVTIIVRDDAIIMRFPEVKQRCAVMREYYPNTSPRVWYCSYWYDGSKVDSRVGKKVEVANWALDMLVNGHH